MQAEFCLKQCSPERPCCTVYDHDLRAHYLLHKITLSPENNILNPLLISFREAFSNKPEYVKTLRVLLENNLEIKKTAYDLGIHRNTLLYRLESIKEASGLDPVRRLDDAIIARILINILGIA
jgi:carbohydrate diacid regulator